MADRERDDAGPGVIPMPQQSGDSREDAANDAGGGSVKVAPGTAPDDATEPTKGSGSVPKVAEPKKAASGGKSNGSPKKKKVAPPKSGLAKANAAAKATRVAPKAPASPSTNGHPAQSLRAYNQVAQIFKQVSDPTRLAVVSMLKSGSMHVGQICTNLGKVTQPAVSHHLALLRHGGIVETTREGKNNFYSLTERGNQLAGLVNSMSS